MDADGRTRFIITVDTEGDNLWAKPSRVTTRNAEFLPRFQDLCERYALPPTYLVTYDMASSPAFIAFGRDVVRRGTAEIGMHLHAWNSPPLVPLTPDDFAHQPYLIEFSERIMRQKIATLTALLQDVFGVPMRSHRAGRWAFNATYARLLVEHGYVVDCSVTPHVSWVRHRGSPHGGGGVDYGDFPTVPYFVDLVDIRRPGTSPLLEVPVTIVPSGLPRLEWSRGLVGRVPLARRAMNRFLPAVRWLRPDRRNLTAMLDISRRAAEEHRAHLEFIIHSSELMPGGSPLFRTSGDIDRLYEDLEMLFASAARWCSGATLTTFHAEFHDVHRNEGVSFV